VTHLARFACLIAAPLVALTMSTGAFAQPRPRLQIVVIEGEDAVNVIQQKTAVAPVVEVRDANGQPVAGAVVKFAVTRGQATFRGAKTISVVTNAAGRANALGFAPTGAGSLQMSATATWQAATATTTISQTTVLTSAAVTTSGAGAGASGAAGGGGGTAGGAAGGAGAAGGGGGGASAAGAGAAGAGTGGGISATTIAVVAGAAAGGVVATKKVIDAVGGTEYRGRVAGALVETLNFTSPVFTCTNTYTTDATLVLQLDESNGTVSGKAEINGTQGITSGTCGTPGGTPEIPWDNQPITGTASSISVKFSHSAVISGQINNTSTSTGTFSGSLNGDTITGTLVWTQTDVATTLNGSGSTTIAVTLSKQ
jgi:hypothetical protein